jgi:hypothetical protein
MKTFDDLVFKPHSIQITNGAKMASMDFPNGYGVSVIFGKMFYSNGIDTYELAVTREGNLCYDTPITDDVMGYLSAKEVTDVMAKVQTL